MKVKWKGKLYGEKVAKLTTGEAILVESEIGIDAQHWSLLVQMAAELFITVRQKDEDAITWADIEALPINELEGCFVDMAKKAPADRKPRKQTPAQRSAAMKASSDPLGGGARASAAPRRKPSTQRAAASSTRSAGTSTSGT